MIQSGKEIKVIYTGVGNWWRLRPVSMPVPIYSYYKDGDLDYEPPGVLYHTKYGDANFDIMSKYYFKTQTSPSDIYTSTKRMAAYVINVSELWKKNLAIFLFPVSLYARMKNTPGVTGATDWDIEKIGFGKANTRYSCKIAERTELTDTETKVVDQTMENVSIIDVLSKKVKVYTQRSYTAFDRFEILDFDD
jgi:hypothetical protein